MRKIVLILSAMVMGLVWTAPATACDNIPVVSPKVMPRNTVQRPVPKVEKGVKVVQYAIVDGRLHVRGVNCKTNMVAPRNFTLVARKGDKIKLFRADRNPGSGRILFQGNGVMKTLPGGDFLILRGGNCEITIIPDYNAREKVNIKVHVAI